MYVLYEESGNFKAARIFSKGETTMQVEADTGRRSKIRNSNVLFDFQEPVPAELLRQAQELAPTFEIDFLWECAPQEEFDAAGFAEEYFGRPPTAVERAALIFALNGAPAYFHRRGKGRYRPAPPEILKAALAAIEKKRLQAEQQQSWVDQMLAGELPEPIARLATTLLVRPDKNTMEWKAFETAVERAASTPERLLLDLGAWPHALALLQARFLATNFPKGIAFPAIQVPAYKAELPLAEVRAYSLDDINTTEVDDALSVQMLDDDTVQVGVHIAAPGLIVTRDSELDVLARERMSTVYTPGQKIPMLPEAVIQACALEAGQSRPVVSLYVRAKLETGEILSSETRLERLTVSENLRHDELTDLVTAEALEDPAVPLPHGDWLRPLWRLSRHLSAARDQLRGKPQGNNRIEYAFHLDGPADDPDTRVRLIPRNRDAPLDLMVAEYMVLANNLWGGLLEKHGVPAIYRSQQAGRVRMSTHALPHESIGVPQYAWSTSPLRRYVDLVNQWQLLAAVEHGVSARLVAPFKPRDADLYAVIGAFDSQYALWGEYQNMMERYWCLRWLQQQDIRRVEASVLRDDLVRLRCAPLVTRVGGLPELERGRIVMLEIMGCDELALELDCRYLETVET